MTGELTADEWATALEVLDADERYLGVDDLDLLDGHDATPIEEED